MSGHPVRRTPARLADGREIIYFDDTEPFLSGCGDARARRQARARRAGPGRQMRRDPLTGEWIAMAAHRMDRTFLPPADACPLCPTGRGHGAVARSRRRTTTSSCSRTGSRRCSHAPDGADAGRR